MFKFRKAVWALVVIGACFPAAAQEKFSGLGRAATAKELAAWDIDVRPDFKGLPPGSGTVAKGQEFVIAGSPAVGDWARVLISTTTPARSSVSP